MWRAWHVREEHWRRQPRRGGGDVLAGRGGTRCEGLEETGEGIMGGGSGVGRVDAGRFGATDGRRVGDEEIDVLGVSAARSIHADYSTRFHPLCSTA